MTTKLYVKTTNLAPPYDLAANEKIHVDRCRLCSAPANGGYLGYCDAHVDRILDVTDEYDSEPEES